MKKGKTQIVHAKKESAYLVNGEIRFRSFDRKKMDRQMAVLDFAEG